MPSKKQRRRRAKQQRHEWEEVYVDEEGRELDHEEAEQLVGPPAARASRGKTERPQTRSGRVVEPPSWRKTLRRGALFFPLMLVTVFLLAGEDATTQGKIAQTFVLMAFFLPFSYFMDSVVWRSYQRRIAKLGSGGKER
ncbi:MAG TPA: hypothetical protein VNP93_01050 [Gaiellaceae bacterium]|nr:hypothetical protein [Gaiellaceae bacterium]